MKKAVFFPLGSKPSIPGGLHIISTAAQIRHEVRLRMNEQGIAQEPNYVTLMGLIQQTAGWNRPAVLSVPEKILLLKSLLTDWDPGPYAGIAHTEGFLFDVVGWIGRMQTEGIDPSQLSEEWGALSELYRRYTEKVKEAGFIDDEMILRSGLSLLQEKKFGMVQVSGTLDFRPIELDLLDVIAQVNPLTVYLPYGTPDGDPYLQNLKTRFVNRGYEIEEKGSSHGPVQPYIDRMRGATPLLLSRAILKRIAQLQQQEISVEVIVSDEKWRTWLYREGERVGCLLAHSMEEPVVATRIGHEVLAYLQGDVSSSETDDEPVSLFSGEVNVEEIASIDSDAVKREIVKRESTPEVTERELRAWDRIFALMERLKQMSGAGIIEKHGLVPALIELMRETTIQFPVPLAGVPVLHLRECAQTTSAHRIFVGFSEEYPALEENNFLLRLLAQAHSNADDSGFLSMEQQYRKEELRLRDAIFGASGVSFAFMGTEREEMLLSPMLAAYGQEDTPWIIKEDKQIPEPQSVLIPQDVSFRISEPDRTIQPYMLKKPAWETVREYSAASLTSYANCPFQYYIDYLANPVIEEEEGEALTRGLLIHRVLKSYMEIYREDINSALDRGVSHGTDADRVRQLVEEANRGVIEPFTPWYVQYLTEMVVRFLAADQERLSRTGFRIAGMEESFEFYIDSSIRIYGRADRIDQNTSGQRWVVDYKTGSKTPDKARLISGKEFQLPIYSMAYNDAYVSYGKVKDASFAHIYAEKEYKPMFTDSAELNWLYRQEVIRIDSAIQQGNFPAMPSDRCKYCRYPAICRKGESS